jgi:hypothetical protein
MQRIASSMQCASYAGVAVLDYFRRMTCIHMQGLHTSMPQLKKLPADMSGSDADEDMQASGDDDILMSESSTSGSDSDYSPSDAEFEATAGADTAEASASASQSLHLGLDDPQLNIYLQ